MVVSSSILNKESSAELYTIDGNQLEETETDKACYRNDTKWYTEPEGPYQWF